jgi:hypothetical protein
MPESKISFKNLAAGDRFIFRKSYSSILSEDSVLEVSPSGRHLKLKTGWVSIESLESNHVLVEVLDKKQSDDMHPNWWVAPCKCNDPHKISPCVGAPAGSPQLEEYMRLLGLL